MQRVLQQGERGRAVLPPDAHVSVNTETCFAWADQKQDQWMVGGSPHVSFHEHLCVCYMFLNFLIGCRTLNTSAFLCLIFLLCKNGSDISTYLVDYCGD